MIQFYTLWVHSKFPKWRPRWPPTLLRQEISIFLRWVMPCALNSLKYWDNINFAAHVSVGYKNINSISELRIRWQNAKMAAINAALMTIDFFFTFAYICQYYVIIYIQFDSSANRNSFIQYVLCNMGTFWNPRWCPRCRLFSVISEDGWMEGFYVLYFCSSEGLILL